MKSAAIVSFALAATLALSACSSENGGLMGMDSNQTLGTGAGAAAGGPAGFMITGGPVGTVVGVARGPGSGPGGGIAHGPEGHLEKDRRPVPDGGQRLGRVDRDLLPG